jgi:hypothetical protein
MIKDKKVKVNKQKPSDACPAQLMLIAIKCPLIQRQARLEANPMCLLHNSHPVDKDICL